MHTLQIATFIMATAAAVGSLVRIANHEHDPSLMIDKTTRPRRAFALACDVCVLTANLYRAGV